MIKHSELAIADVFKHPTLGLISFQPTATDRSDANTVRVRDVKGKLFHVNLNECSWPTKEEVEGFWSSFTTQSPDAPVREEKKYSINWCKLSNDMLLEVWLRGELDTEDRGKVERILKEKKVIKEANAPRNSKTS